MELPNTKYYVVGYGGPGANNESHSFTMRGNISSSRSVRSNIEFKKMLYTICKL